MNDFDKYLDEKSDALTKEECGFKEKIIVRADEIRNLWICDVTE